ncbi:hypothetical protein HanXRQr2_Chr12g0540121 [Helianthus annuus]|uniref:Uncharacterized protein n=2 Tax=Helianthus annuus TaxID=4232 RepID=A0A9K3MW54_HELAN|nr:hypothetical protein HanXRQr2_Chr12g0540121 [Helianthus annuus]KAJ0489303.1 hypothetical protein HanHA300_Chr12g0442441 [Helianthus annuus]KAJ0674866.1 hypothetical protein HanLR1_Chr12g0444671 [Helianthus annuus]
MAGFKENYSDVICPLQKPMVIDQSFGSSCKQAGSCFGEGMFRLSVPSMNQVSNSFYGFRTADLDLICCMCA